MYERPAMDISNAEMQDTIANSLLGEEQPQEQAEEQPQSEYSKPGDVLADEEIADADPEGLGTAARLKYGDAVVEERLEKHGRQRPERMDFTPEEKSVTSREERIERRLDSQEQAPQQQEQPLTIETFQAAVADVDAFVKDSQLNEIPSAAVFPHELAGAFGTTPEAAGLDS